MPPTAARRLTVGFAADNRWLRRWTHGDSARFARDILALAVLDDEYDDDTQHGFYGYESRLDVLPQTIHWAVDPDRWVPLQMRPRGWWSRLFGRRPEALRA